MKRLFLVILFVGICLQGYGITLPKIWIASETITHTDINADFAAINGALNTSGIPSGLIAMWSGSASNVPSGWHICDGAGGTPNLSARFVISSGGAFSPGATGGNATGTTTMIASTSSGGDHLHSISIVSGVPGNGSASAASGSDLLFTDHEHQVIGNTATNGAHIHGINAAISMGILPPYYSLCYIMKL